MTKQLFKRIEKIDNVFEYKKSEFEDIYAKLACNNDNQIEFQKIIDFVKEELKRADDLLIAVYWIGFHLKPEDFLKFNLKQRFKENHLLKESHIKCLEN